MLCPLCQSDNPAQSQRCRACGTALKARADENGATPDALANGTLLGGTYAIEEVLGQGGFGITYRCHDQMLDRPVAVKEFFPSGSRRQQDEVQASRGLSEANFREARAQFLAEARVLARCHHVGIVGVYTAFEANQTAYMVMELLSGKTLAQLLTARGGRMNEAEAVGVATRVGEALSFVHGQNLLHRDIKPDNIIVCDDGRVMLIDFGTARETIQGQVQGQTVVVTPGYAPLEQYAKQAKRGAFTDVYSLAATLYHLLTGQMPPTASDRAMGVQLRAVREINPLVSVNVARAVERALQMEIARRPQSVREFLDLLEGINRDAEPLLHPQLRGLPFEEDEDWSETDGELPAHLAPDALRAHQQQPGRSGIAITNAQPVKLAPPRDPASAIAPPAASTLAGLSAGGVNVQNSANSGQPGSSVWWGLGAFLFFIVLMFMLNAASRPPAATSDPWAGTYVEDYAATEQTNLRQQKARRAWEALSVLPPSSVETLPASESAKLPDFSSNENGLKPWNNRVEFSPDGTRLALIDGANMLRVLSLPERQIIRSIALDKNYVSTDATFSNDNQTIAVAQESSSSDNPTRVDVWNVRNGKRLGTFNAAEGEEYASHEAVLSDERVLMRTYKRGTNQWKIFFWNPKTGERNDTSIPAFKNVGWGHGMVSPDAKSFVLGDDAGRLQWFDMRSGKRKNLFTSELTGASYNNRFSAWENYKNQVDPDAPLRVDYLDYSTNGAYLASHDAAEINVFNSDALKVASLTIDGMKEAMLAVSSDGNWLAARGALPDSPTGNLLWNVRSGEKIRLQAPAEKLLDLGFSPDGKQLRGVFAQNGKFQMVTWQVDAAPVVGFAKISEKNINTGDGIFEDAKAAALANGAVAVPLANSVGFYQQSNGELIRTLGEGVSPVAALKYAPDGKFLLMRGADGAMQGWRMGAGASSASWQVAGNDRNHNQSENIATFYRTSRNLAFASDSRVFACARFTGSSSVVELWSLKNENKPSLLARIAQTELVTALAFSPDDNSLICGGSNGLLQRIDMETRQVQSKTQTGEAVEDIAFADGKLIVLGGSTTRFYEWPASSRGELTLIAKREIPLRYMEQWAISDDGELLVMAPARGGDLQIWQLSRGLKSQSLRPGSIQRAPGSLTFAADGTRIIALQKLQKQFGTQLSMTIWERAKTPKSAR